jgi:hypothetical protein
MSRAASFFSPRLLVRRPLLIQDASKIQLTTSQTEITGRNLPSGVSFCTLKATFTKVRGSIECRRMSPLFLLIFLVLFDGTDMYGRTTTVPIRSAERGMRGMRKNNGHDMIRAVFSGASSRRIRGKTKDRLRQITSSYRVKTKSRLFFHGRVPISCLKRQMSSSPKWA